MHSESKVSVQIGKVLHFGSGVDSGSVFLYLGFNTKMTKGTQGAK